MKSEIRSSKPETNPKYEVQRLKTGVSLPVLDLFPFPPFRFVRVSGFGFRICHNLPRLALIFLPPLRDDPPPALSNPAVDDLFALIA
jgi:hypothetical protein